MDHRRRYTGTVKPLAVNRGRESSIRTPNVEEPALDRAEENRGVSTR
jgi:hypothetical protein